MTVDQLAVAICRANHPYRDTTGVRVPCGEHATDARRFILLIRPGGAKTLSVLVEAQSANPR